MQARDGRTRVVIARVEPQFECGQHAIKRTVGEQVSVEADVFTDGHDAIGCRVLYRKDSEEEWYEADMEPLENDRWRGEFTVTEVGRYFYTIQGWVEPFRSWRRDLEKRVGADTDTHVDYLTGAKLIDDIADRLEEVPEVAEWVGVLRDESASLESKREIALNELLASSMHRHPRKLYAERYSRELPVRVDRERARFGSWYEFFPRSRGKSATEHGTFADCHEMLAYAASMNFDIVYLPPVHPIGRRFRKGKNNNPVAEEGDVGSPWAIGADEGGHKAIHPALGTIEDFRRLVDRARELNLEVALDIAFQCAPDHPYVKEHPEWFRQRPDGTIQYAENPPKKYQDIYPIDFETPNWQALWEELKSVFVYWCNEGIRLFRVDNPHTKAFRFWEWVIAEIQREFPEAIFLSEAFTRPVVMYQLAKLGFTQSYTYFTWRNTKPELVEYFTELTRSPVREFFRPNLWPNTPDILPEYLQFGGRPAFMARLVLAATLGASYGIYGPAFELCDNTPREPGSEEYLNSEKYQIKHWDLNREDSLRDYIARVNRIRRENPALAGDGSLHFHATTNDHLICYSKRTENLANIVLTAVNLDPHHVQSGFVELDLDEIGIHAGDSFQVHDLLTGERYLWQGPHNYLELNPHRVPAHIMVVRRRVRTEQHFDYFM